MSLALKGVGAERDGQTFPLKSPMVLGRTGDLVVLDRKSSSRHAEIRQNEDGSWILEDLNSKNGTRVDGERVPRLTLRKGTTFYIGDQGFEVIELADENEAPEIPLEQPDFPPPPKIKSRRYWYDILSEFIGNNANAFHERTISVTPFTPALVLDFVLGLQNELQWTIGYGPRKVGSSRIDLPILEPGAPPVCFEVVPTSEGILFTTAHSEIVKLNGEPVDSQLLRVGDKIKIFETLIEVDFSE